MNKIVDEMLAHTTLCSHPEPKNILLINGGEIKEELKQYQNLNIIEREGGVEEFLSSEIDNSFDIIIAKEIKDDEVFYAKINSLLNDKGIFTLYLGVNYYQDIEKIKSSLELAGRNFTISMPFTFGDIKNVVAILSSKKYHPTADIILQKSDLLEGLEYYNSEIHLSSFVLPTAIKKSIIKVLKH